MTLIFGGQCKTDTARWGLWVWLLDGHKQEVELTCVLDELGYYPKPHDGDRWAQEHEIPAVRLGPRKRGYEIDLVAKAAVSRDSIKRR